MNHMQDTLKRCLPAVSPARWTRATLATECMIRNADKRVFVVVLARFRCSFCTKSLLSLLLRRTCKRFRDRKSLQFAYGEIDTETRVRNCAETRSPALNSERQTWREESLAEGEVYKRKSFEPSAECSLRNSRCKANKI